MKTKLASLIVGLLASLGMVSHGQTLEAKFLGVSPSITVSGSFNGGASYGSYQSGLFNFDLGSAFCVDPYQTITNGETIVYTLQDPATLTAVAAVSRIVGGYFASAQTALDAAGAQWAIWESIVDGAASASFAAGTVRLQTPNSSVGLRAMDYLNNLASLPVAPILYATNPTRQDMVSLVPEPSAILLGLVGAVSLVIRRRR